jgi:hypothetical protein
VLSVRLGCDGDGRGWRWVRGRGKVYFDGENVDRIGDDRDKGSGNPIEFLEVEAGSSKRKTS